MAYEGIKAEVDLNFKNFVTPHHQPKHICKDKVVRGNHNLLPQKVQHVELLQIPKTTGHNDTSLRHHIGRFTLCLKQWKLFYGSCSSWRLLPIRYRMCAKRMAPIQQSVNRRSGKCFLLRDGTERIQCACITQLLKRQLTINQVS